MPEASHTPFWVGKDQTGRPIELERAPKRIVSLVPSQTELLADLELEEEVVGITKFCIHPQKWFRNKTRVGGTKNVKLDVLLHLVPDLVIANKEENTAEDIQAIAEHCPVWVSQIEDLDSALDMIGTIGQLTTRHDASKALMQSIRTGFEKLHNVTAPKQALRVVYLIWKDPIMAAGTDTFIHEMLKRAGFENAVTDLRYPTLSNEELEALDADFVLLSSEPFPFKGKHVEQLKNTFPNQRFVEVDGELFSWYGSRLLKTPEYLQSLRKELEMA